MADGTQTAGRQYARTRAQTEQARSTASSPFPPYEGTEPYIFVSYSHKDSGRVLPILSALHNRGYRVWYDEGIPWTSEWPAVIEDHLYGCEICLAFHSAASVESIHCRREIHYALQEHKRILPVYLENVRLRHGLGLELSIYQSVRLSDFNGTEAFINRLDQEPFFAHCRDDTARREAERRAKEETAYREAERKVKEIAERLEAERKAKEEATRREAERKAKEETARREAEQRAKEEAARREAERKAKEEAARREAERKAKEETARREAERRAKEEAAHREAERRAKEETARREAERKAKEEAARQKAARSFDQTISAGGNFTIAICNDSSVKVTKESRILLLWSAFLFLISFLLIRWTASHFGQFWPWFMEWNWRESGRHIFLTVVSVLGLCLLLILVIVGYWAAIEGWINWIDIYIHNYRYEAGRFIFRKLIKALKNKAT